MRELTTAHKGCTLIADKGLWGRGYRETLALQDVSILTPDRVRTADNLLSRQRVSVIRREEELNPSVRGLATFTSRWRSTIFVVFGSPGQP